VNLYVVGWNLPEELSTVALAELRQMTEVYPQLDPKTTWHFGKGEGAFAASVHTATQAAAPRRYVWQSEEQVTIYDGCPVDRTGSFPAHDAETLSSHWDRLPEVLEGQFAVVRLTGDPPGIELLIDWLGVAQVYYVHHGNMWLVSNSVGLISRIVDASAWDPLGVSLFLSVGFVGGDRTLRRDVRVIPGGEHWQWQQDSIEPRRQAYYPVSKPASQREEPTPLARHLEQLADQLTGICRNLGQRFGELECPLTGGRDSRLLAALLISGGIPAKYFTGGEHAQFLSRSC
jgi:asparagine synthase (glutamine-hydrolysing)